MPSRRRSTLISAGDSCRTNGNDDSQRSDCQSLVIESGSQKHSHSAVTLARSRTQERFTAPSSVVVHAPASLVAEGGQYILPTFGIPFAPKGHLFPVPSLPEDVAWEYPVAMSLGRAADFATVLLQRGILHESDWKGRLVDSITEGLRRWANETMGAYSLEHFNLDLFYTDDIMQLSFQHDEWLESAGEHGHPDGDCETYGAFGFETGFCQLCEVGDAVEFLNTLEPTAGYVCVRVLQYALMEFFPYTPNMCHDILENYHDEWAEPEDENPQGLPVLGTEDDYSTYPTEKEFRKEVPQELYVGDYSISTIVDCLAKTQDPKWVRLLTDVITLHHLAEAAREAALQINGYEVFGHGKYSWESHVPPVAIFNRLNGIEESIFDDFRDGMVQGEHTYLCFMHTFDMEKETSIQRGVLCLEWAFKLLVLSDSVLQGLNWDQTRDHRFDTSIRTCEDKSKELDARTVNNTQRPLHAR